MSSERTAGGDAEASGGHPAPGTATGAELEPEFRREAAGTRAQDPPGEHAPRPDPAYPREPYPRTGPRSPHGRTYAELYQQQDFWSSRPRAPLPTAPVWLPVALLGVGVLAALLATFDRPGLGLVITGTAAGLTALAALVVRPAAPGNGGAETDGGGPGPGVLPAEDAPERVAGLRSAAGVSGPDDPTREPAAGPPDTEDTHTKHADTEDAAEATGAEHAGTGSRDADARGPEPAQDSGTDAPGDGETGRTDAEAPDTAPDTDTDTGESATDAADATPDAPGPEDARTPDVPAPDTDGAPAPDAAQPSAPTRTGAEGSPAAVADTHGLRTGRHAAAWSAVYGVIAAALLLTAALRDAGWVLFWTLTSSFLFASLAFATRNPSTGAGAAGVAAGALSLFRNLPSTPRFLTEPLRSGRGRRLAGPVLLTTVVTGGLLFVFGLLFSFADAVFASYVARMFEGAFSGSTFFDGFGRLFAVLVTVLFTGSAVLAARRRRAPRPAPVDRPGSVPAPPATPLPVWVWTIPLGALVVLFTAFLGVQAVAMFGGDDHVQRVAGVTYAEYARQGFFQLVVVSLLVLCVIAVAVHVLPSRPAATRTLRNALLGLLCVLTLVILASAMMRLQLYIDTYGLTRLRISAEAWIVWSAGVFGLVVAAGVLDTLGRPAAWLPRATAALAGVALVAFAYGNPDLRIAESHHGLDLAQVDTWYLRYLSADALPALLELEGEDRACALAVLSYRVDDPDSQGLASWNLSRHSLARTAEAGLLDVTGQQGGTGCWDRYASDH
ncbi:DUF4173 domain-containing protein [Nocardiopsis sp. CT-R113]|uniref:DUF4173 domain-containing protein n=1 Tax=Nocardiopsis codii TaxID=3065942 RepID=A0ABU7K0Y7_9ACTN|nr:DUF4153 domain-containing protein [Nocardiopsis sp. CT-R113]MEE2035926.1 DUF4173 domain-containing protein [Nocardiopsis sp. CT-R113]